VNVVRTEFADIHFDFLGFQFRARKVMWVKADRRIFAHSFQPAASPKASTRISREIRSWAASPQRQIPGPQQRAEEETDAQPAQ
jgi:hypothetical protein